jgi:ribosomal protein S18 acetylase RimI-like enzyme
MSIARDADGSPITYRAFTPDDHAPAIALWASLPGITLRDADAFDAIAEYLGRNPGCSWVAVHDGQVIGTVLAGSDGRRGILHHVAVVASHRGLGVGRALVQRAPASLAAIGVDKSHVMVRTDHPAAQTFWRHMGWQQRDDIVLFSTSSSPTA